MRLVLAVATMLAVVPAAYSQGMKGMDMKDMPMMHKGMDMKMEDKAANGPAHKATGVVTKVDAARNKVTIKHEPVQSLGWPAMTMAFTVKDKAVLDKLAIDKKVTFEFKEEEKDYVITSVK
jgi:Cu(I)/Ag(I) efflux system protein CusF